MTYLLLVVNVFTKNHIERVYFICRHVKCQYVAFDLKTSSFVGDEYLCFDSFHNQILLG